MMRFAAPQRILLVAVLCIGALVGLVISEARARAAGVVVILPMQAVDPRDLLSGHYVTISLAETLPEGAPCPATIEGGGAFSPWMADMNGWVALAAEGDHARVVAAGPSRESLARLGDIAARGAAHCSPPSEGGDGRAILFTDLNVDRFHINQRDAERIDRLMRAPNGETPVAAIFSIGQDGRARLKGLLVENERLMLSMF